MYSEISPADVISAINGAFPAPSNPFELAMYFRNLEQVCGELEVFFEEEYNDKIFEIKDEPSDEYAVRMVYSKRSAVDSDKLRELRPDIYGRIVFVRSDKAERILTRRRIYELCEEAVGSDKIREYESVNKGDLEKNLQKCDVGQFISYVDKEEGYEVVRL